MGLTSRRRTAVGMRGNQFGAGAHDADGALHSLHDVIEWSVVVAVADVGYRVRGASHGAADTVGVQQLGAEDVPVRPVGSSKAAEISVIATSHGSALTAAAKIPETRCENSPTEIIARSLNVGAEPYKNCKYKDFGVGMTRVDDDENSVVAVALGEPAQQAPPPPQQARHRRPTTGTPSAQRPV